MDFPVLRLHVCDLLSTQAETYNSLGYLGREKGIGFSQQECQEKKTPYSVPDTQICDFGVCSSTTDFEKQAWSGKKGFLHVFMFLFNNQEADQALPWWCSG